MRILERDNFSFCEIFTVMQDLRNKLKDRLNGKFFSAGALSVLSSDIFSEQIKQFIEADFCVGLQRQSASFTVTDDSKLYQRNGRR